MGYTKHKEIKLNAHALPKMIIIGDTAEDDLLSYPVGSGTNVSIRLNTANKAVLTFLDAGHSGTWLAHARKDATFTINFDETGQGIAFMRKLTQWLAGPGTDSTTDGSNARVLDIVDNNTCLGFELANIQVDWAV